MSQGISYDRLQRLVREGSVERVARGLYRLTEAEPTEHYSLAAVCARVPRAVVCLLSALRVHDIGTQLPHEVWIAIPHKARVPRLSGVSIRLVRFAGSSLRYGVVPVAFEGVPALITNPARTVVDCFRFQRLIGREAAMEALREAVRHRKATVDQIWRTAEVCRARSLIGPYIESLVS
ncbi:MAG: type IV toxin-antitoxin system AbiEi family antitoxin domain-containing protein [Phycisphaerae bacterium]|nr:type IV toxin-antitoxin system AbiEi family antitoxin domain-containing protein [Phycisphaerae bacterium]